MADRPWQRRRPGESVRQYHARLNRTCYACGQECATTDACDTHEASCPKANSTGKRKPK